ncbi:MAG TPA: histidine kinase [Verrucomicrobia bacterium]|nr:histidine kinase [Verrucomicrobiota bacterium]
MDGCVAWGAACYAGGTRSMKRNSTADGEAAWCRRDPFRGGCYLFGLSLCVWQLFFFGHLSAQTDVAAPMGSPAERVVRVGCYENKPKIFTDDDGLPSGIFPAILDEIARIEGWRLVYVPCEWDDFPDALESGVIDIMPDVAFSMARQEEFDFNHELVLNSWSSVYARKTKQIKNIYDLNGMRVAVLKGSIQQEFLQQMIRGMGLKITLVEAQSFEDAFRETARGHADAAVSNCYFGDYFHQQHGLEKSYVVLNPVTLHFVTSRGGGGELLAAIDDAIKVMKAQPGSAYYKALMDWIPRQPKPVIPTFIVYVLFGLIGVSCFGSVIIWVLRRQVNAATASLVHTNEMLKASEKKFRDLFEKHTAVKLIIEPESGMILEANESAGRFYGYSTSELLKMRVQELSTLSPEEVGREIGKAMDQRQSCLEFKHCLADGTCRDVEVFSSAIDFSGKTCLHCIIHDITEKREVEERYRQAQKMEAVGQLAGGIAHDYNNMLTVILGYTDLALKKVDRSDPLHADLIEVYKAGRQSADITRQLLAFARKQPMRPEAVDLNRSITNMRNMIQRLIGEDIELIWKPGGNVGPVFIDPSQIDQILVNLCTNARDAIAGVGKIVIATESQALDRAFCQDQEGAHPGAYTVLSVADDGCGMSRETITNIYEPFYSTKEVGKGTGLGLSTVYGIVSQSNGFIKVQSEPGKGTTFRVFLPRHEGHQSEPSTGSPVAPPVSKGETVLLVEDDKAILSLAGHFLERLGYKVLMADRPRHALHLVEGHVGGIDLLVTDVIMPEMSGRELYDRISGQNPSLKVLFMSGYTADVITERDLLEDHMNFLQKPFSFKDFAIHVSKALGATPSSA